MPIRLGAVTDTYMAEAFSWIVQRELNRANDVYTTPDKKLSLVSAPMIDQASGETIGRYVFTIRMHSGSCELLDVDVVLNAVEPIELHFDKQLPQSSDSNEYYEVVLPDDCQRGIIETVNRSAIEARIEGTAQTVGVSAFPFALTIFENESELNRSIGFGNGVHVGRTKLVVQGLSPTFACPGNLLDSSDEEELWSCVVGTVESFKDVVINLGKVNCKAYLGILKTGFGPLPTLIGKSVFDTDKMGVGSVIMMKAYVKADFRSGTPARAK